MAWQFALVAVLLTGFCMGVVVGGMAIVLHYEKKNGR